MYAVRETILKALVWLAALLLPVQALPAASCCCAAGGGLSTDAAAQHGQQESKRCCCCRNTSDHDAGVRGEARSCCSKAAGAAAHSCCECLHGCSCQKDHSPPPVPPAPPETRSQGVDQLVELPTPVCLSLGEQEPRPSDERPASFTSASERCITLCRFHL